MKIFTKKHCYLFFFLALLTLTGTQQDVLAQIPFGPPILLECNDNSRGIFGAGTCNTLSPGTRELTVLDGGLYVTQERGGVGTGNRLVNSNTIGLDFANLATFFQPTRTNNDLSDEDDPRELTVYNNAIYLSANSDKVNPTVNGGLVQIRLVPDANPALPPSLIATPIKDILPGGDGKINYLTASGGLLFFSGARTQEANRELWISNGTESGTVPYDPEINTNTLPGQEIGSFPMDFTEVTIGGNTHTFFTADAERTSNVGNGINREIYVYRTDVAPALVQKLEFDLNTTSSSNPKQLTAFGEYCYFMANLGTGFKMYRTQHNTTTITLEEITLPSGGSVDTSITPTISGSRLYFVASNASDGNELYSTQLGSATASLVMNINPGSASSNPYELTDVNGFLYFGATTANDGTELWRTNGTVTSLMGPDPEFSQLSNSSNPTGLANVFGGLMFFVSPATLGGRSLMYYNTNDPTNPQNVLYEDFLDSGTGQRGATEVEGITAVGDSSFFFLANGGGFGGQELWFAQPCPAVSFGYFPDPALANVICKCDAGCADPMVRPTIEISPNDLSFDPNNPCNGGPCFSTNDPTNLILNTTTGEINRELSEVGTYTVTYNHSFNGCVETLEAEVTIDTTFNTQMVVTTLVGTPGVQAVAPETGTLAQLTLQFGEIPIASVVTSGMDTTLIRYDNDGEPSNDGNISLALSPDQNKIYLAEEFSHCIRVIDLETETYTTLAGSPGNSGKVDGIGTAARFNRPSGIAVDPTTGFIFVADKSNHVIRQINPSTQEVQIIAGNPSLSGADGDNPAQDEPLLDPLTAFFNRPTDLEVDANGNIYVSDRGNHKIKIVTSDRRVFSLTRPGFTGPGHTNGPAGSALMFFGGGIVLDSSGNILFADQFNNVIRKLDTASNTVVHVAGAEGEFISNPDRDVDGPLTAARFGYPADLDIGPEGEIYVADRRNHKIKVIRDGMVTLFAGDANRRGSVSDTLDAAAGNVNAMDTIPVFDARFKHPSGILAALDGSVYVVDKNNQVIRKIYLQTPAGRVNGSAIVCQGTSGVPLTWENDQGYVAADIVRWEQNDGSGWVAIPGTGGMDSFNTGTILTDTRFRVVVLSAQCGEIFSNFATIEANTITPPLIISNRAVCGDAGNANVDVTLVASGGEDGSYVWYDSTGAIIPGETNDTLIFPIDRTSNFSVSIDRAGCESVLVPVVAEVIQAPTPAIVPPIALEAVIAPNGDICANSTVSYTVDTLNVGNTYTWEVVGGNLAFPVSDTVRFSGVDLDSVVVLWGGAGPGEIRLTEQIAGTDCSNSDTLSFTIQPNPTPSLDATPFATTLCVGDSLDYSLGSAPNPNSVYTWTVTGGVITNNDSTSIEGAGPINVRWIQSTGTRISVLERDMNTTCEGITPEIAVTVNITPEPFIDPTGADTVCGLETHSYVALNAQLTATYTYIVTGGVILPSRSTSVLITGTTPIQVEWDEAQTAGTVQVQETNGAGCTGSSPLYAVVIQPKPTASILGDFTACDNGLFTYDVDSTTFNAANTYNWELIGGVFASNAGTSLSNTNTADVYWTGASPGTIRLIEITPLGCSDTTEESVTIQASPTPGIQGSDNVCVNELVTYQVDMVQVGSTYRWEIISGGNGEIQAPGSGTVADGPTSIDIRWTSNGVGQLRLIETNSNGCSDSTLLFLTIRPIPDPILNGSANVCQNDITNYSVTNPVAGNTYNWTVFNGVFQTNNLTTVSGVDITALDIIWTGADSGRVEVIETNSANCTDTSFITVQIDSVPDPEINGNLVVCSQETLTYRLTSFNAANNYDWEVVGGTFLGGGNTLTNHTLDSVQVVWGNPGAAEIRVRETINTVAACFGQDTIMVSVNENPLPVIQGDTVACAGRMHTYQTASLNAGNTYTWNVIGGTFVAGGADNVIIVTWPATGNGVVQLTEETPAGCIVDAADMHVTLTDVPDPNNLTGDFQICAGSIGTYQAITAPAGITYQYDWIIEGGTILSTNNNEVQVQWDNISGGFEYVRVIIGVVGGSCVDTTTLPGGPGDIGFVQVNPLPSPEITSTDGLLQVCSGASHIYETLTPLELGHTYQWITTGTSDTLVDPSTPNRIQVTWGDANSGSIRLIQTIDSSGCFVEATPVNVSILANPGLPQTTDRFVCTTTPLPRTLTLTAEEPTATSYRWYTQATGGTPIPNENQSTYLFDVNGEDTVYVSAVNGNNCEGPRQPIAIAVDPANPTVGITETIINADSCVSTGGDSPSGQILVELTSNNTNGPYSFAWSKDEDMSFSATTQNINRLTQGNYRLVIQDEGGCITNAGPFLVQEQLKLITDGSISPDTLVAKGEEVILTANATDAVNFVWTDSLGNILADGPSNTLTFTPEASGRFSVLITNDRNCSVSLSVNVEVVPLELFVPNMFSPNGDQTNDRLQVYGTGIQAVQLRIFDRLGQLVFETDQWIEGTNLDPNIGWDGTFKGQPQQNGNYVWSLSGTFINNQAFTKTGNVILTR